METLSFISGVNPVEIEDSLKKLYHHFIAGFHLAVDDRIRRMGFFRAALSGQSVIGSICLRDYQPRYLGRACGTTDFLVLSRSADFSSKDGPELPAQRILLHRYFRIGRLLLRVYVYRARRVLGQCEGIRWLASCEDACRGDRRGNRFSRVGI